MFTTIRSIFLAAATSDKTIKCYHCGEKSKQEHTVHIQFDGAIRPVCCQGCAAILRTVEELVLHEEYRNNKIRTTSIHEE
jgi:hypothetical protein